MLIFKIDPSGKFAPDFYFDEIALGIINVNNGFASASLEFRPKLFRRLPLDVKKAIALDNDVTWLRLMMIDEDFKAFALSAEGVELYMQHLPVRRGHKYRRTWWFKGLIHRNRDLPAIEYNNGRREWRLHGQLHRDNDKPSIICANPNLLRWYKNGNLTAYTYTKRRWNGVILGYGLDDDRNDNMSDRLVA